MRSDLIRHRHKRLFRDRIGKFIYKDEMDLLFPWTMGNTLFDNHVMRISDNTIVIMQKNFDTKYYTFTGKIWKETNSIVPSDFSDANYSLFLSRIPKMNFKIGA